MERQAVYAKAKSDVSLWDPVVHSRRAAEHLQVSSRCFHMSDTGLVVVTHVLPYPLNPKFYFSSKTLSFTNGKEDTSHK